MCKTLNEIKIEIENIAENTNTLSLNQIMELLKQSIKDLGKLKLEEDNEG